MAAVQALRKLAAMPCARAVLVTVADTCERLP
eukprot:CAMPEP_0195099364 /NCGR_PEP_ID=MMETSP0448-20130528/58237_1 /TAXON_ID=66468 /ORGANISM="Heterocapsa triquestra, Strain CCMP 448" /LENGTH=31 /DNA_ID= /DNA_START= /DNA_END= /DNA_ORIENTATION=